MTNTLDVAVGAGVLGADHDLVGAYALRDTPETLGAERHSPLWVMSDTGLPPKVMKRSMSAVALAVNW